MISNEFFDLDLGGRGGFGWIAREVAEWFNSDPTLGVDVIFLTTSRGPQFNAQPGQRETSVNGTRLLYTRRQPLEYFRLAWIEGIDLLMTIDYRPNYRTLFRTLPKTPAIIWIRDPRTPEDESRIHTYVSPVLKWFVRKGLIRSTVRRSEE